MENHGLGSKLLLLPNGIKQFAIVIYSQFSPFPSWGLATNGKDLYQIVIGLIHMISPLFWFTIWFSVIRSMFVGNFRKSLSKILILSFIVFIAFLIANSSNLNVR